jgi:UPF0755 protein
MGNFISLIRFIFNAVLLFLGMVAVVIIAAILNVYSFNQGDSRIIIEPGPLQGRYPTGSEARALRSVLKDRVDELNTSLSNDAGSLEFHIDEGENAASIAARLQALGFIHDAQLFGQLLHYNKIDIQLQAGTYQLRRNMTMRELGAALYRRHSGQSTITVPAGWRLEQLAEHLNVAGVMDGRQFLRRARQGTSVDHYLLADRPPGQSYEGYLFPSAYSLPDNPTPDDLLSQMLNKMASRLPANTFELARQQGLTFYEVLTLASIISSYPDRTPGDGQRLLKPTQPGDFGDSFAGRSYCTVCYGLSSGCRAVVENAGQIRGVWLGRLALQYLPLSRFAARSDCQPWPRFDYGRTPTGRD